MKNRGYATALYGKWHLGWKSEFGPNAHGFDEFFGILSGNVDHYSHKYRDGSPDLYENTQPVRRTGYLTELITERAVRFIEDHSLDPFFVYISYNAVHWPFQPPGRPDDIRNLETWYDGNREDYARMVESIDEGIGQILLTLDRHKLFKDTLVIFTNDNGGERFSRNWPLFHHKATLWEGGIRVPCLLQWPGQIPAGTISNQVSITMDLTATILSATGADGLSDLALDGIDLLPILKGSKPQLERTLFWRIDRDDRKQKAARKGRWKYLRDGSIEMLFDLERDIGERQNLGYENPDMLGELRELTAAWENEMDRVPPAFSIK